MPAERRPHGVKSPLWAGAHLVGQVGLHLEVLQPLLDEGHERARRHVIAVDVAFVHEALVAEGEGRVREACGFDGHIDQLSVLRQQL